MHSSTPFFLFFINPTLQLFLFNFIEIPQLSQSLLRSFLKLLNLLLSLSLPSFNLFIIDLSHSFHLVISFLYYFDSLLLHALYFLTEALSLLFDFV